MKKVLIITSSLIFFNCYADESTQPSDSIQPQLVQREVTVDVSGSQNGLGAGVEWNTTSTQGNHENTISSTLELRPVAVDSEVYGTSNAHSFHIDILGDSEKKVLLGNNQDFVVPYFQSQYSGLEYTRDGYQGSWRMLNGGVGVGVRLNLSDDISISSHAGLGLGVELGKRDGILDTSLYAKSELDINDVINIVVSDELRGSFQGDRENIKGISGSIRINDNIRAGAEYKLTHNTFNNGSDYSTQYGGVFIGGTFGRSK